MLGDAARPSIAVEATRQPALSSLDFLFVRHHSTFASIDTKGRQMQNCAAHRKGLDMDTTGSVVMLQEHVHYLLTVGVYNANEYSIKGVTPTCSSIAVGSAPYFKKARQRFFCRDD